MPNFNESKVESKAYIWLLVPMEKYSASWPVPEPTSRTFLLNPIKFLNSFANLFLSPFMVKEYLSSLLS